jgi:tetratricopeptide (TPR) repeat protein
MINHQPTAQQLALARQAESFKAQGDLSAAADSYRKLLKISAKQPAILNELGTLLLQLGQLEEGCQFLGKSLKISPLQPQVLYNRGIAFGMLNNYEEALASFNAAIALKADSAEFHYNRGKALKELGMLDEAIRSYQNATKLNSSFAEAYYNLGNVQKEQLLIDEAIANYDRAISLKADYPEAYWNKACLKLLSGEYEEGWQLYEWRWKIKENPLARNFSQPLWLGRESISGKTLLVHTEQGLGDVMQFCRYLTQLEDLAGQVIFEAPESLVALLTTMQTRVVKFIAKGQPLPAFDLHCPIMSLPHALKTQLCSIPADIPYLFACKEKCNNWQRKLGDKNRFRIGLVWSGAQGNSNDANRSIPFKTFIPLLKLPFEFHCLQKEIRPADSKQLKNFPEIRIHQDLLQDFSDTAALAMQMDLVISVDTSIAHLSGALGLPVWIILAFLPDFRWLRDRKDSPWYPTAQLFRQSLPGDWSAVIAEITASLHKQCN